MPRIRKYTSNDEEVFNCPWARGDHRRRKRFGSGYPARYGYEADEFHIRWNNGHRPHIELWQPYVP